LLSPALSSLLFPDILLPALVAEVSYMIWLLAQGVRSEKWDQLAPR
jgi:hypothetical protein